MSDNGADGSAHYAKQDFGHLQESSHRQQTRNLRTL